ncbi:transcriptional regulator, LysR family [Pseudarthrobacter chlorophenolicus A6]|uniref:Transcriptional regulator, LysR family n=1 Tax=Pseudarthrobacter chlorophenolicus (strain ATCC 700700 / DSM 12829 / CIP 107037 / JCM 12360 / KCTC 9906 / NCIMB 13794 / A6) TaxID=452863 RepID=B8HGJ4_PSECP|nr:LysR family transcriptional regulator [Pseudarthrobacter chlorophenolicus]ACL41260.1 transcriptional regulator, LysR family [Pseudarthrobacter chlorophenolicus A6]
MDLISGARAFVAVARRQSFSAAARDEQTTQPVISRRVAGLEAQLGGALLERNTRQVRLTALGTALLEHVQALLGAERSLVDAAASHHRGTVRLLVPRDLDPARWAALRLRARGAGTDLDIEEAGRELRTLRFRLGEADAAVLPVETARADWVVPLGLAQVTDRRRPLSLGALRPTRALGPKAASNLLVLAEDASGQLLSALRESAAASGLAAHQVHESPSVVSALAGALAGDDWILCTREQASAWRLQWFEVPELALTRAYRLELRTPDGRQLFNPALRRDIAAALGANREEQP